MVAAADTALATAPVGKLTLLQETKIHLMDEGGWPKAYGRVSRAGFAGAPLLAAHMRNTAITDEQRRRAAVRHPTRTLDEIGCAELAALRRTLDLAGVRPPAPPAG
jgi:hypothetical protein